MTAFLLPLFVVAISLPLSLPAALSLFTTASRFNQRPARWHIRNRFAAFGSLFLLAIAGLWGIAQIGYLLGGCTGGHLSKVICNTIPHDAGSILFTILFLTGQYLAIFGLPAMLCFVLAEFFTRKRLKF